MSLVESSPSSRWVVVALILLILTSAGAAVVILVSQRASASSVETLSTSFMREVAARAGDATLAYLDAGPRGLEAIQNLADSGLFDILGVPSEGEALVAGVGNDSLLERQLRALLAAHEAVEMFNFGRSNGDFLMVKRMPDASLSTKRIYRRGGVAESTWHHDNSTWAADAAYADRREDAAEAYDPRTRPWYLSAVERGELSWVDPYIYYSDRKPGIACARPLLDANGRLLGVIGADIGIAELSRLLDTFQIGSSGKAAIVTGDGELIAGPDFLREGFEAARDIGGPGQPQPVLRRLGDAPNSVLTAAFEARPTGAEINEPFTFEHAGTGYVARFDSFPLGSERRWLVGVLAPQEEFMGSLRRDHWMTLAVTLLCLFLAIGLAAALVMRADALEIQLLEARTVEKQHLIDELEARNEEMERFAYTVSHDLKSPLVTIRGYLGMLEKDMAAGQSDRVEGDLRRIKAAAGRMAQLLDEVLELSRIGIQTSSHEFVSMSALAREAAENVAGAITQRGVELDIDPKMPPVEGDRPRLLEVLQNLIENAVKFMGDQPRPRIEIGWRLDGSEVVFYVRDNGIGVAERFHEKIFGLFERLDLGIDGTGVGLALVQRIAKAHDGRAWVESEGAGCGSTFCFTLPRGAVEQPA